MTFSQLTNIFLKAPPFSDHSFRMTPLQKKDILNKLTDRPTDPSTHLPMNRPTGPLTKWLTTKRIDWLTDGLFD